MLGERAWENGGGAADVRAMKAAISGHGANSGGLGLRPWGGEPPELAVCLLLTRSRCVSGADVFLV